MNITTTATTSPDRSISDRELILLGLLVVILPLMMVAWLSTVARAGEREGGVAVAETTRVGAGPPPPYRERAEWV